MYSVKNLYSLKHWICSWLSSLWSVNFIYGIGGKRACWSPDGKWSQSPMDTHNTTRVAGALLAFKVVGTLLEGSQVASVRKWILVLFITSFYVLKLYVSWLECRQALNIAYQSLNMLCNRKDHPSQPVDMLASEKHKRIIRRTRHVWLRDVCTYMYEFTYLPISNFDVTPYVFPKNMLCPLVFKMTLPFLI